jgi:DNA polymerase-3 subunit delta'
MAFKNFPEQQQGVQLLQRSLERGRLAHAYLFTGHQLEQLELLARTLAKTLNCLKPVQKAGSRVDCCDKCLACTKIEHGNHADVHWIRPESKSRVITIEQIRSLMKEVQLKATEAEYKIGVVVAADRLRIEGANAFLKTLEEPPAKSLFILLTTDAQRLLETILSRCLRLNFGSESVNRFDAADLEWLTSISDVAASDHKSLLSRYRLMDLVLRKLNSMKAKIEEVLTARSPLQRYKDVEKDTIERWEGELAAAVEAEYRGKRTDLLSLLQWWLRDVWLETLRPGMQASALGNPTASRIWSPLSFPQMAGTRQIARRLSSKEAAENLETVEQLQRWLGTNAQEALALEVGLLKLHL